MDKIIYFPQFGSIRPNGSLRVPMSGRSGDGTGWEGETEIGPDHSSYNEWRRAILEKERHLTVLREERMQTRERLRRAAEWKRTLKQWD